MDRIEQHRKMLREQEERPKVKRALEIAQGNVEISAYRNERNLMLFPFCSTARKTRFTPIEYQTADGKRWLSVSPNAKYGMAKIWDFDVLRHALSKAGEVARMEGCTFPPYIDFSAYECLKALKKSDSKRSYEWLEKALDRLATTAYSGNIFKDDERTKVTFTLIDIEFVKGNDAIDRIRIRFNQRLIDSVRYARGLLEIDPNVIREDSGLKKRILELVKTSIGKQQEWTVGLIRLQELCASERKTKFFKRDLKNLNNMPWDIVFSPRTGGGENVTFIQK